MIEDIQRILGSGSTPLPEACHIYEESIYRLDETILVMVSLSGIKYLVLYGKASSFKDFDGEMRDAQLKLCPLTHANRLALNNHVSYTVPQAFGPGVPTFGAGDRLGLAGSGLLRILSQSSAKPILAQQSKRELDLTGRTYDDILDAASFAVFQQGYQGGFGADGDHLKQKADIFDALDCGFSMITLDCSEKIGKGVDELTDSDAKAQYGRLAPDIRAGLESTYLNQTMTIDTTDLIFSERELIKNVLIYYEAIQFTIEVYRDCLLKAGREIDFEISIDETEATTTEYGHYFVASELRSAGVRITSLAPRFIGEFQKGIDYIGDLQEFEKQLGFHAAISDFFGYKLSIHSGSDKFSVFPLIGRYTKGLLHIKVSGTNWLSAIAAIAECSPGLYRAIHGCALLHFEEARKSYHVSTDLAKIPDLDSISDNHLIDYLKEDNARQLLHITYGYVLRDSGLKKSIYAVLNANMAVFDARLTDHIRRHLVLLGLL